MAASLAEHIHRQHKDSPAGSNLAPDFLWVLRDFALALEDQAGNEITEAQYLDQVLRRASAGAAPTKVVNGGSEDLRDAREKILDLFPNRNCITLVIPVDDESKLQRLGDMPLAEMRPKFVAKARALRNQVFTTCKPLKGPSGEAVTGDAFLALVTAHVEAMNSGGMPQLGSIWEHISHSECDRAVNEGERAFQNQVSDFLPKLPVGAAELREVLAVAKKCARSRFDEVVLGEERQRSESFDELERRLSDHEARILKENAGFGASANELWLQRKWDALFEDHLSRWRNQLDSGHAMSVAECADVEATLRALMVKLEEEYGSEAVGEGDARDVPWQQVAVRRSHAAFSEIADWGRQAKQRAASQASADDAGRDERARLQQEGEDMQAKVRAEVEESKARVAALQAEASSKAKGEEAPAAADGGPSAQVDDITLDERKREAMQQKSAAKKCCLVQ